MSFFPQPPVEDQIEVARRLNDGAFFANHPSHDFTGIDGRCFHCDSRPFGRHAPHPCPVNPSTPGDPS